MPESEPAALVDAIVERVLTRPYHEMLLQTRTLLNELGRDEEMAALIKARITRDVVDRLATREGCAMGLETTGAIYTGPNQTGRSMIIGIPQGDRYYHVDGPQLGQDGFFDQIQSGRLFASPRVDVSLAIFWTQNFDANFLQLTAVRGGDGFTFWATGPVRSYLLTATSPGGAEEVRMSYRDMFAQEWKTLIDEMIRGSGRRDYEPVLNWDMFPTNSQ